MAAARDIRREFGPHPLSFITAALEYARVEGIRVRIGARGVVHVNGPMRKVWLRDRRVGSVDPIGAAILHRQPPASDIHRAAELAVNAPMAWVEGCTDGMERRDPSSAWSTSVHAAFYATGYQAGAWLRVQLVHNVEADGSGGKV